MSVELYAPEGYKPKTDCNGCGSGWNAKLVPDTTCRNEQFDESFHCC